MPCWRRAAAAAFSGDPAFLDSAYAQVQSDVGVVGTVALLTSLAALSVHVIRQCRDAGRRTDWAACGVLGVALVDWIGRSTLASYTTGFLTLYVLGLLIGAGTEQQRRGRVLPSRRGEVRPDRSAVPGRPA